MSDFSFEKIPGTKKWMISALGRAKRTDVAADQLATCPFCVGKEGQEPEVYRIQRTQNTQTIRQSDASDAQSFPSVQDWQVRVIPNKYPFAPIHEIVIHSPDHHKNFGELSDDQVELILSAYRHRYNEYAHRGQVVIFHNRGEDAGESLPHPHTQIAVVPAKVHLDIPPLPQGKSEYQSTKLETNAKNQNSNNKKVLDIKNSNFDIVSDFDIRDSNLGQEIETAHFLISCPTASQWADEVWIGPKTKGKVFGEVTDIEIGDLANALNRLVRAFEKKLSHEFAFNFYIYPHESWYLRFIPRHTILGGFEVTTGVFVNTQDPSETIRFLKREL